MAQQVLGRKNVVLDALDRILADEFVLYAKTRGYHWNVEGPQFAELHALFEKQYRQLSDVIDEVAERTRALGRYALGSAAELLKYSSLKEAAGKLRGARAMVQDLQRDHELLAERLGEGIEQCGEADDYATQDLLIELQKLHQKSAWMLRATLSDHR